MKVRELGDDEAERRELARLTVDAFTAEAQLSEAYLLELADVAGRAGEATVVVAVDDDGTVLGGITYVARAGRWANLEGDDQVELRMLAVEPRAQGRGVGAALVQACVERARLEGKRLITLHTTEWMRTAQRIYQRAGFRREPGRDLVLEHEGGLDLLGYVLHLDG